MSKRSLKLIVLFSIYYVNEVVTQKDAEIKLLQQYVSTQTEPNVVSAFLCWQKGDLIKLFLALLDENSYVVTRKTNSERLNIPYKEQNLIVLDFSCPNANNILQKANQENLFGLKFRWFIFMTPELLDTVPDLFKNINILIDSRVILAVKNSDIDFDLYYIYKVGPKSQEIIFTEITNWKRQNALLDFENEPVVFNRKDLRKQILRTCIITTLPDTLQHLDDYRFVNRDTQAKIGYLVSKTLFSYMNATMEIVWEKAWGEYVGNNTYTGLLGRLHRKEIDVGASPLFCIGQRLYFYDCVARALPAKGFFMFKQPPLSHVANIFTLPFETNLWLTDIAFLIVCALLLYFIVNWEWSTLEERKQEVEYDMIAKSFWEAVMFTVGAVCQQGYPTEPKSGSGKIIILTLFFTLLFMFTAFSANTVVLFQSSATSIKTLEDLYDSKMQIGVDDTLFYRFWFPRHFDPIRKKIYADRIAPKGEKPHFMKIEDGIEKMRHEYFAFHTDEVHGYKIISDTFEEHEKCGLQRIPYLYVWFSNPWNTTPKNSSYRELFYIAYKTIHERGVLQRELNMLFTARPECASRGSSFRSAGFLDLYSVYMLYFLGLSGAIGLLIVEIIMKKIIEPYICRKYYMRKKIAAMRQENFDNTKIRRKIYT